MQPLSFADFKRTVRQDYPTSAIDSIVTSPGFDTWLDKDLYRFYRLYRKLHPRLSADSGSPLRVLDVGSYPFTGPKLLKLFFPHISLYGVGLWHDDVNRLLAADPLLADGRFALCNLDPWVVLCPELPEVPIDLPFSEESFDVVVFTEVVEHLFNPGHALRIIHQALKPGGLVYMTTNNVAYFFTALRLLIGETNLDTRLSDTNFSLDRRTPTLWRGHIRFYSARQLREMLELAGFSHIQWNSFNHMNVPADPSFAKRVLEAGKWVMETLPVCRRYRSNLELTAVR